jgi:hypothetical protein
MEYNIIRDYDWTSVPRGAAIRDKAPRVTADSYIVKNNLLLNRLQSYLAVGQSNPDTFYEQLYRDVVDKSDIFILPYFENSARNISNTWGDTFVDGFGGESVGSSLDKNAGNLLGIATELTTLKSDVSLGSMTGAFGGEGNMLTKLRNSVGELTKGASTPGSYIERPKFYDYASAKESSLNVRFALSNTLNSDFYEKNYTFVKKLIEISKPTRKDAIAVDPPRIFRVKMNGYRYMPWAYISNLTVDMMGTKRMINGVIIPESYEISVQFEPLTIEVSNFLNKV